MQFEGTAERGKTSRKYHLKMTLFTGCFLIIFSFISGLYAQIYQGPAAGSIGAGAIVSTDQFTNKPEEPLQPHRKRIVNPFWEHLNPPYVEDRFNVTPPSAPMGSNEFYDASVTGLAPQANTTPNIVIDFEANSQTNSIPPDPIMAVGPDHVISMVNSSFVFYDKQGNVLFSRSADAWFQNVLPYSGLFDPIVVYDNIDNRFVMCWDLQNDVNQTGYWLVSVSDDENPMGNWCNYAFPAHLNGTVDVGNWGDYQKMGYDHQAVYISGRQFSFTEGFQYCKLRIIPKSELYDPACPAVTYTDFWDFRDPNNSGVRVDGPPIVASHLEATNNTAYMVVDSPYITGNFITLWKIVDPLGTFGAATLTAVNISTVSAQQPPDANQLGGGTPRINSGRRAYRNAAYMNGKLWTSTAIAGGTGNQYAFARYLQLDVMNDTVIEDVSFGANGYYYLYPAIMVDEDENIVIGYTRSGDNEYAGAAFTGRRATDAPGLAPSTLLKAGEGNYVVTFGGTRNRWGDYLGIAPDPKNPSVIWALIEYAKAPSNTWANRIGAFSLKYAINGTITAEATGDVLENASVKIEESGAVKLTDENGDFQFGAPTDSVTVTVSKFEYQTTSRTVTLEPYFTIPVNVALQPELQADFTGQISDESSSEGIFAHIEFYAKDNPNPEPYLVLDTDSSGNFVQPSFIGEYDLRIYPESPYPYTEMNGVLLDTLGTNLDILLSPADLMIVDDDDGSDYENYFINAAIADTQNYHHWNVVEKGLPTADKMAEYPNGIVIWFTGDSDSNAISDDEAAELLAHLNNGGKLFLSGQDIVEELNGTALMNQLGIGYVQNSATPVVRGETGGIIGDGLVLITGAGAAGNQTSRDQLIINDATRTTQEFRYGAGATATAGISYKNGASKAIVFGFGFEAITDPDRQNAVIQRAIQFFKTPVGIGDLPGDVIPEIFALEQNYPNPFNPETTIRFSVPERATVLLQIYNTLGQKVRTLANARYSAGIYDVRWDGRDDSGNSVTSGIYFYRIEAGANFSTVRKMILMK
ncbi:MAG: carboxypeptidase-like regulatory domain-containing protein [Calditrichaeota bacterium]|nr:carboxypeptidase-like regulatory domain-containing protein [Calditrichota bacterium]